MEHLFKAWPKVATVLARADHILLLSDYHGTLTPIVERPEMANLPYATGVLLRELTRRRRFKVGIISGRALSDLKMRVGLKDVIYAGNHGLEIEGPALSFVHPVAEEFRSVGHILYPVLKNSLGRIKGAFVEDKGLTLSVHYRLVDGASVPEVATAFEKAVGVLRILGRLKVTEGKKVFEVRPAVDWDKGKAIFEVLASCRRAHPKIRSLVIFLGDDLTDEDGFRAVVKLGGVPIFVGEAPEKTAAGYYLRSPGEVQEFLSRLLDAEKDGR